MSGRDDVEFNRWADTRLDRWLVDWALRTGKEKTARQIAHDRGIEVNAYNLHVMHITKTMNWTNYFIGTRRY